MQYHSHGPGIVKEQEAAIFAFCPAGIAHSMNQAADTDYSKVFIPNIPHLYFIGITSDFFLDISEAIPN